MSVHSRTDSESSYDFVKADDEAQKLLTQKQEKKGENREVSDVLSFNGDVSSEEEDNISEAVISEDGMRIEKEEAVGITEKCSLQETEQPDFAGDSLGLTVQIPEETVKSAQVTPGDLDTLQKSTEKKEQPDVHVEKEEADNVETTPEVEEKNVECEKKGETPAPVSEPVVVSDPLGAMETPILDQTAQKKESEKPEEPSSTSIILSEITLLRFEVDKLKRIQAAQKEKISQFERNFERQKQLEKERREKHDPPIQVAIRGEWRLVNMPTTNEYMKSDGINFCNRWPNILGHTVYDFDGLRLSSSQKLFCKSFNHSSVKLGIDISPSVGCWAKTFIEGKKLITVWKSNKENLVETKERMIIDGRLHVCHIFPTGERRYKIYERVKAKTDVIYTIGNASCVYLKFW